MKATLLVGDRWVGDRCNEWTVETPSEDEIRTAIERLDGRTNTLVLVRKPDASHLAVGGGPEKFVVYATFDDVEFFSLLSDTDRPGEMPINAGGQIGDYPASQIVDLDAAVGAALEFARSGELQGARWLPQ